MNDPISVRKLQSLLNRGYQIIGKYSGSYSNVGNWIYLKRGPEKVATPFSLDDHTANRRVFPL